MVVSCVSNFCYCFKIHQGRLSTNSQNFKKTLILAFEAICDFPPLICTFFRILVHWQNYENPSYSLHELLPIHITQFPGSLQLSLHSAFMSHSTIPRFPLIFISCITISRLPLTFMSCLTISRFPLAFMSCLTISRFPLGYISWFTFSRIPTRPRSLHQNMWNHIYKKKTPWSEINFTKKKLYLKYILYYVKLKCDQGLSNVKIRIKYIFVIDLVFFFKLTKYLHDGISFTSSCIKLSWKQIEWTDRREHILWTNQGGNLPAQRLFDNIPTIIHSTLKIFLKTIKSLNYLNFWAVDLLSSLACLEEMGLEGVTVDLRTTL